MIFESPLFYVPIDLIKLLTIFNSLNLFYLNLLRRRFHSYPSILIVRNLNSSTYYTLCRRRRPFPPLYTLIRYQRALIGYTL